MARSQPNSAPLPIRFRQAGTSGWWPATEGAAGQRARAAAWLLGPALIDFAPVSARNAQGDLRGVASLETKQPA